MPTQQTPTEAPRPYAWQSIGGHLALDLCNTVSWRLDPGRQIDRLATPASLIDWFCTLTADVGTTTTTFPPERDQLERRIADFPEQAEQSLHRVRDLRAATTRLLDAQLGHGPADPVDVERIASAWRQALAVATTGTELPLSWRVQPTSAASLADAIGLSVADLLHRPDQSALRRCDGDGCGWFFLDTTRNHSRRWCDPLDCGNRARVRSYAERHRKFKPQP